MQHYKTLAQKEDNETVQTQGLWDIKSKGKEPKVWMGVRAPLKGCVRHLWTHRWKSKGPEGVQGVT